MNSEQTVNYTHDLAWNIMSITSPQPSPAGEGVEEISTSYAYDIANRLTSIIRNNQNIADYSYDSLTQTKQILWNWVTTSYTYDSLLRLQTLWTTAWTGTISNYWYRYDQNSNITTNGEDSYEYDILNQITVARYGNQTHTRWKYDSFTENFHYDPNWNIHLIELSDTIQKTLNTSEQNSWDYNESVNIETFRMSNNMNQYEIAMFTKAPGVMLNEAYIYDKNTK